ncbi:hypothetical protein K503DRAFT_858203 [Rhizopogon vinicolor AM-OR11-026]|uniref:MYND-type domain-containing protein n=1 Tax=Rhizopogon vinicolor AM-OR11-026 TaxID=1314800 RepID=A0A1B7MU23_9AGAM|nr:hypothetical protein K503DRAFT_858203 [Rhizopogon vinicolor AM-OR11-026]
MALRINARDRAALKTLPRLIQRKVSGALHGSVEDLRYVVASLDELGDAMLLLLPVFHAQLEAYPVPDGVSPDVVQVIMLAKLSMGGIVTISSHIPSNSMSLQVRTAHDAVASKWEMLFSWMQFFSNNFLPPSQIPAVLPHGLFVSTYDALIITVRLLSVMSHFTEVGRQMMKTNPTVQAFFFRAWVIVGGLKRDDLADPLRPGDRHVAALTQANICSISVASLDGTLASLPVSIIASAAGGTIPMASLALRYIRRLAKEISNIPEPMIQTMENVDFSCMLACVRGLAQAIRFMQSLGQREGGCQELFLQMGAVRTVLHVVTMLWERLLTPAWNISDNDPNVGLAARREALYMAYRYIAYSMNCADDSISVVSQALQHGLLECLLRTGTLPAERVDNARRFEYDHDIQLLKELPRFFVFSKVLRALGPALQKVKQADLEPRASRDPMLWDLWQSFDSAARIFITLYELPGGHHFYRYQCGNQTCSVDFSENDVTALGCSGCLLTRYCSKSCQKDAWKSGHRIHCRMLRSAIGNRDIREIRKSLPIIAMTESWILNKRLDEIKAGYESIRDMMEPSNDRYVLQVNMSVHPVGLSMYPLRDYPLVGAIGSSDTFDHGIADLVTTTEDSAYDLVAVKVRFGRESYSLFSPATALGIAFGWTSGIQ